MLDVLTNVVCPFCNSGIDINCNKYVVDTTSHAKDMGVDTQWIIQSESMVCPHCNNEIILEGTVGIYPEDTIEFIDVRFKEV